MVTKLFIKISIFVTVLFSSFLIWQNVNLSVNVLAQGGATDIDNCPTDSVSDDCDPPTLQEIEFLFVRVLYWMWVSGGVIFFVYLLRNGYMVLADPTNSDKYAKLQTLSINWVIGFFLFYLSLPIISFFMKIAVADIPNCYDKLRDPGFKFFFNEICEQTP